MLPLVTRDEFVRRAEVRHHSALLEPEDGGERPGEEDALNGGEGDETRLEIRFVVRYPAESPVSLALNGRNFLDGVKERILLFLVADEHVNHERLRLAVYGLNHALERLSRLGLRPFHLLRKPLPKIFEHDAVAAGEEGEHVLNELAFAVV